MPMEIPGAGDAEIFGTYFDPIPIWGGQNFGTAAMFANAIQAVKFRVGKPFRATSISVWCVSAAGAGNVNGAIYEDQGALPNVFRLSGNSTAVAVAANAEVAVTFATPVDLVPNKDYWAAVGVTEGVSTFLRGQTGAAAALNALNQMIGQQAAAYPPAAVLALSGHQNFFWTRIRGT